VAAWRGDGRTIVAMSQRNRITCVCFDAGGVVVRICRSWDEGCAAAGIEARGAEIRERTLADRRKLVRLYERGEIDDATFFARISAAMEGVYTPAEVEAVHRAWILGEYAGIGGAVDLIHDAGLETAMLSNTNASHWAHMHEPTRFPSFMRIRNRHASHLLRLHKPDVEIYDALAARIGRRPGEIIFFDDLQENVEAARAAGWEAVQVDPHGNPAEQVIEELGARGAMTAARVQQS
jgi:glucose-1-phosphatase